MKKNLIFPFLIIVSLSACTFDSPSNDESSRESLSISSNGGTITSEVETSSSIAPGSSNFIGYAPEGYSLSWEDEFLGRTLNKNYWEPMIGDGSNYGVYRWGNNEEQYYKEENAIVDGGCLHILAEKESTYTEKKTFEYTSARLRTRGKVSTTYGYIEARIQLPLGTGLWPAFWMLPEANYNDDWWPVSGEIDIMEAKGRLPTTVSSTIHTGNTNRQDVYKYKDYSLPADNDMSEFHCYGVEWSLEGFKFFVDGQMFFEVSPTTYQNNNPAYTEESSNAPFDRPFHILLNLAVGGNYDGGKKPDATFEEAFMVVDYVRIYKKA